MPRSLLLTLLFWATILPSAVMAAPDCMELIRDTFVSGLVKQSTRLNPQIFSVQEPTSLLEVYRALKAEYEKFDRQKISDELASHIKSQYGRNFDFERSDLQEMTQVYRNFLAGLFARTMREWRLREITNILGELDKSELELMMSVLDRFARKQNYFNTSFGERSLTLAEVEESFAEKRWLEFPWDLALQATRLFISAGNDEWKDFSEWLNGNHPELAAAMGTDNIQKLMSAEKGLRQRQEPEVCCQTRCYDCPLNFGWRRAGS